MHGRHQPFLPYPPEDRAIPFRRGQVGSRDASRPRTKHTRLRRSTDFNLIFIIHVRSGWQCKNPHHPHAPAHSVLYSRTRDPTPPSPTLRREDTVKAVERRKTGAAVGVPAVPVQGGFDAFYKAPLALRARTNKLSGPPERFQATDVFGCCPVNGYCRARPFPNEATLVSPGPPGRVGGAGGRSVIRGRASAFDHPHSGRA